MPIKFYLHNDYSGGKIHEILGDQEVPEALKEKLVEEIYTYFYEVGFNVEYDVSGKITNVSIAPKKR